MTTSGSSADRLGGGVVTATDMRSDKDARPCKEQSDFLVLKGLTKRYGNGTAVDHLDVSVRNGELVAFLGPSGCGKTTTLRLIAGFIKADDGSIEIAGKRVDKLPSRLRGTAMVFQDYALFPHMTVAENIAFGLKMRKVKKSDIAIRVREVLELVQLHGVDKKYRPNCPAACDSASPWRVRSWSSRGSCYSTSRCRTSTPSCASNCGPA